MRRFYVSFFVGLLLFTFSVVSYAGNNSIGINASTLGIGPEVSHYFSKSISARIGFNYFSSTRSSNEGNIDYNLKAKLRNLTALIDWHPFKGKFRITAGVLYNKNKLEGNGKASGGTSFTIGNHTYNISEVAGVYGKIEYQDLNPYLGFGWDTTAGKDRGLGVTFNLGAIYQGKSKVSLIPTAGSPEGKAIINGIPFKNDLNSEINNVKHNADKLKIWPVVSLGLVYRF